MTPRDKLNQIIEWNRIGFFVLPIRFVLGFIFWGGGSRRFFYAPSKLDPHSAEWLGNKLQAALPGSLFDISAILTYLLEHETLLLTALILFTLAELLTGIALILGCFTRLAGMVAAFMSITLMLVFGWEGGTCLDEWTMSVAMLAMSLTIILAGSSIYSIDAWLLRRYHQWSFHKWFLVFASGPLSYTTVKRLSLIFLVFAIIFTMGTYNYFRGSIISKYHEGPVSATTYHLTVSDVRLYKDGNVVFTLYVDAGTPSSPYYIVDVSIHDGAKVLARWDDRALSQVKPAQIKNFYAYNRMTTNPYALVAPVSAKAQIFLLLPQPLNLPDGEYQLMIHGIDGKDWIEPIKLIHSKVNFKI